jgi:hypothetical protein
MATHVVPNGAFLTSDDTTAVSLGDASDNRVCTHCVQITGTWAATLIFEGTLGGPEPWTYVTLGYTPSTDRGTVTVAGTFTANGIYYIIADGLKDVRIRPSIEGTGTPVILLSSILG